MTNKPAIEEGKPALATERLNPKNDYLFRRLFGEEAGKRLLISLLNAVLGRSGSQRIADVAIIGETQLGGEWIGDKEVVLDILCKTDRGDTINVEMQIRRFPVMEKRSLYYAAQMMVGAIHRGESYADLKRVIGINILDHRYLPLVKYHSTFHLYEDEEKMCLLTDALELHYIECPKFQEVAFHIDDPLHRWLRFLEQDVTPEQLQELMEVDEMIREAEDRLNQLASDEVTRRLYEMREKALHDRATWLEDAMNEGMEQGIKRGIEQGIEQGVEQTALRMLARGFTTDDIAEATGMDLQRIESLRRSRG
ncbi:Rpn family recombination-promoting nuclease/putative transposase [Cohnella fermenti]|uniref:Rpn family recombination-promoting nuclease/putative transposase n=1 Tax=Cohnella fermenti TaxID=2565925 RepID=A0A4S4BUF5_9BACL|nr:Rpn family recombination-promoting nuclease/putative transposase [Cohnella fermenti]THF78736.1 Rpn family recombination-promoting nuclease/putative transposase [Cohnella fermenti]